ncbi:histidine kinase [Flavobacterium sp. Sd200]|uniref:sensor histidine kinase n=1 Tax=Flavobacterium sp. Sd200 TaxID=2692211 RepID=UPI00136F072D|nr:histidine kinase [Flavobacterium sp. Sd200]MXN90297.1 histidine kinase [Flavobacterium sp. Sd200]
MIDDVNKYVVKKWRRVLFTLLSLLLYYFISFLLHPTSRYWQVFFTQSLPEMLFDIALTLLFCIAISWFSIILNSKLNKLLPWTEKTLKRSIVQSLLQITGVVIIIFFQIMIGSLFYDTDCESDPLCNFQDIWSWITGSIVIGLVISSINTGSYVIESWKKAAFEAAEEKLKAAEMKRAVTEAELNALKLQIDPHFVFNNLSVLSELILKDQKLGYEFSENFSKVYRYLLVNSRKDLIALSEELKFVQSYIFLLQNRIGLGVSFSINIDDAALPFYLPPLTLQLLIENALKHNQTTKSNPLKVNVYNEGANQLVVENTILPIQGDVHSSGTGLKNIIGRYTLLGIQPPLIVETHEVFKVVINLKA